MTRDFNKYQVKILNKSFVKDKLNFAKTAEITFLDKEEKEIEKILLAYLSTEDVYRKIDLGEDLKLDNCYLNGFSLSD